MSDILSVKTVLNYYANEYKWEREESRQEMKKVYENYLVKSCSSSRQSSIEQQPKKEE